MDTSAMSRGADLSKHAFEVLWQLFRNGPTWDGDVISKTARDELYEAKFIDRLDGWQWLTRDGVELAMGANYHTRKDSEQQRRRTQ